MAGYSFLANMLPTALTVASTITRANQQKSKTDAELRRQLQQNSIRAETEDDQRRKALQRAMARQRAQFGAQGISSADGSAAAVLMGLQQQNDAEQAQSDQLNNLRNQALQETAKTQQRKNLLSLNETYDALRLSSLFSEK